MWAFIQRTSFLRSYSDETGLLRRYNKLLAFLNWLNVVQFFEYASFERGLNIIIFQIFNFFLGMNILWHEESGLATWANFATRAENTSKKSFLNPKSKLLQTCLALFHEIFQTLPRGQAPEIFRNCFGKISNCVFSARSTA